MARTDKDRAYMRDWRRRQRAAQRLEKKMNLQTMPVTELAALKQSGIQTKDLDLLNAIEAEVWRRINSDKRRSSRTPVKWSRKGDGSVSGKSEPL